LCDIAATTTIHHTGNPTPAKAQPPNTWADEKGYAYIFRHECRKDDFAPPRIPFTHHQNNRNSKMAEAAGLILGVAGIPAVFASCVDCLDYITLERNYGKDFEVSLAKVSILKGRLHGCGESLSITTASHHPNDASSVQWKPQGKAIRQSLLGLHSCFNDEQKLQRSYGLRPVSGNMSIATTSSTSVSPSLAEVQSSFNLTSTLRQKQTPLTKRVRWVIHDKKKFDSLVSDALFYIESIEAVCIQLNLMRIDQELCEAAVDRVTTREGIRLLERAIREMPAPLMASIANDEGIAQGTGHIHIRTTTSEQARVALGNAGMISNTRHYYRDANFGGRVLAGDSSVDAVKLLFA
jgi:hypothetical protein